MYVQHVCVYIYIERERCREREKERERERDTIRLPLHGCIWWNQCGRVPTLMANSLVRKTH